MRTGLFLVAGLCLVAAALLLARLFAPEVPSARNWALGATLAVWLALTVFNLWIGVSRAGYSLRDELPIFLFLFVIPAAAAFLGRRWLP